MFPTCFQTLNSACFLGGLGEPSIGELEARIRVLETAVSYLQEETDNLEEDFIKSEAQVLNS